ncbi:MAG: glycosyltransferase family 4 protein [Chthoniobacterales bacterium]|nr:glycosyltransferase family 4 protein [Chthoniobacterales bacterium]
MKVTYDISVLSHGYRSDPARTGIFRVIDRTAKGLQSRADVELQLSSAESWENHYWAGRFLEDEATQGRNMLAPGGPLAAGLYHAQDFLYGPGAAVRKSSVGRAATRIVRRVSGALTSRTSPLRRSALTGRDIFHSGFHAFPDTTLHVKGLRRFVTVYDLIPVLFPEFFAEGISVIIRELFLEMLRSIGPDDYVLAISEATRRDLCAYLPIDPARVFVAPLAASENLFYPVTNCEEIASTRARYGIPIDAVYLLSVNTLEPRKNMAHALRCFAEVLQESGIPDLYFVLVGTRGWDFQGILNTIADSKLIGDRVILAGFVPDEELAALYSGALAFVYPSHYEGFGLPPLEAMQCGTPVITSNTSSLPEVVGDAGIMISPTDSDALSQAMLAMYQQPSLRSVMEAHSLARSAEFSWTRYTDDVVRSYRTALRN